MGSFDSGEDRFAAFPFAQDDSVGTILRAGTLSGGIWLLAGIAMGNLGPAGESLRLSELYRRMSDDELIALARHPLELTDLAQRALGAEVSQRRLRVQPEELPTPVVQEPADSTDDDPTYAEERQLVEISTVWSARDAEQVQDLLNTAGIPFYMGREKATKVEAVTSKFGDGVSVEIMQVGVPWAREVMQHYEPKDAPADVEQEAGADPAIHCPKCHSTEVVFDRLVSEPTDAGGSGTKYLWSCDSCGHEWEDEGVVSEK